MQRATYNMRMAVAAKYGTCEARRPPALHKRIGRLRISARGPGRLRRSQVTVIEPAWLTEVAPHFYEVRILRRRRRRRWPMGNAGVPPGSPEFCISAAGVCACACGGHACVRIRERL